MPNNTARHLRAHQTECERVLWRQLRHRQLAGHRFRRQFPVGPFVVDFVCLERRLVVEVDGEVHDHPQRVLDDCERDAWLVGQRFEVLRLRNGEVIPDPMVALVRIKRELGLEMDPTV